MVVIDEVADLMMVAGKEIEAAVQRLAGQAAGIHVIMATQRPSVDVITGTIKANFPTRISFQVTSRIDSRTILGKQGAEQLLGAVICCLWKGAAGWCVCMGRLLMTKLRMSPTSCASRGPDYNESVTEEDEAAAFDPSAAGAGQVPATGNSLYDEAVALVIREQASTNFVQRHLKIGYNRAATLIEEMESTVIISAANHVGKERFLYRMKRTEPVICRLKLAVLALMASLVLPSHLVAQSEETKLIARAEQAITELTTLQAKFIQISSDGTVGEGQVYFRRPFQLRLEYKPETLTIVTGHFWVYIDDKITQTVEAYPVSETPFAPLLAKTVSFRSKEIVTEAQADGGIVTVQMEKDTGQGAGRLALEFEKSSWQLRRWIITDSLGVTTTVTLQNPVYGPKLANRLFGAPSYEN